MRAKQQQLPPQAAALAGEGTVTAKCGHAVPVTPSGKFDKERQTKLTGKP